MGKRREPSVEEQIAEQREVVKDALDTGKTELDLRTESIDVVREACAVKTLTKLTLRLGKLDKLPKEIGELTELEQLHIDNNQLTSLPDELGKLSKLTKLVAYSNKLTVLTDAIGQLRNLRELVLWSNQLRTLPKTIGQLTKVTELSVKWNELTSLPDEFDGLESLEELELASNKLHDLPKRLSGLKKLRRLELEQNQFKVFPAGLLTLPALVELKLSENQLVALPADIDRIATLRELDLERNKLTELPAKLWSLPLVSLKLNQNQLTAIPSQLGAMPSLIELELWHNPIKDGSNDASDELLRKSKNEILAHFGLWKPKVGRHQAPPAAERAAIVKAYKVGLENFVRAAKKGYQVDKARIPQIVAFVTGETDDVPAATIDDSERLSSLVEVMRPYAEWTFVERRILEFITQEAWRYKNPGHDYVRGFDQRVYRWLEEQLEAEPAGSTLAADLFAAVGAEGISEESIVAGALRHMSKHLLRDGQPTSFGRFILAWAPAHEAFVIAQDREHEELIALFVRHARDLFARIGEKLLKIAPDEDGETHVPYDALEHACTVDPARFEALLLDGIARTDCDPCRAEAGRVLAAKYPKHRAKALEVAKRTLKTISERSNKEERYRFPWSGGERWSDGTAQYIGWVLDTFGAEIRADVHELVDHTNVFSLDTAEVLAKKLGQDAIDTIAEGLKMSYDDDDIAPHFRRMFALLAPLDWSKYHDLAWELARSEHRMVRETACLALGRLPARDVMGKAIDLLASKKGYEREAGVLILTLIDDPKAKSTLRDLLATETSDDARDLIVDGAFREATCDRAEALARVKSAKDRGKLERPVAKWLDEKKLPKLMWGKTALDADAVRFLCYRQTRQAEIAIDPEARGPLALIDRTKSASFAEKLLALVMKNGGASAKTRFALTLIGALGDDSVVAPLEKTALADRNENAVRTLGLVGTMGAARALDRVMKMYRVKYPNVREAAQASFDSIADRLGMTPFELADTMIPDFGMKQGRLAIASTKPPMFVTIGDDRKLAYVDAKGTPAKPPKTLAAKPKAELKTLAADLKDAAKQLAGNLEYYLIVRRRWTAAAFAAFFETNPLARSFARGLVWAIYRDGKVVQTFRIAPDGAKQDVDGKPIELAKTADIGIAHPLEMADAERTAWTRAMASATPAFAQLDRSTFAASDEERVRGSCFRFDERELSSLTFKGRAERRGWRRGSVIDSGEVSSYRKLFPHDKIEVFIKTSGLDVQSFEDGEVTLKDLFFVRPGSVVTGSYTYDEPRDEQDDRLIRLGDVPAIVFSEAIADLVAITKQKDDAEA